MSYDKQTWQTGDVVTSAKLNHMEDGIAAGGGGVLVVNVDDETGTLDKTWQEIADAKYAVLAFEEDGRTDIRPLWWFQRDGANYKVAFVQFTPMLSEPLQLEAWVMPFVTNSADGYPATQSG